MNHDNLDNPVYISQIALLKVIPLQLNSLVVSCSLHFNRNSISTCAFVDSGGNGFGFVDSSFVQKFCLPVTILSQPRTLRVVDGRTSAGGKITHMAHFQIRIDKHFEYVSFFVTKLGQFPIILGYGWLNRHNPDIHWNNNTIRFSSQFCRQNCLPPPLPPDLIAQNGNPTRLEAPTRSDNPIPSDNQSKNDIRPWLDENSSKKPTSTLAPDFRVHGLNSETVKPLLLSHHLITPEPVIKNPSNGFSRLPEWLKHQHDVFSKSDSRKLPPHRDIDHKIVLKEGSQPPFGKLYGMTREELIALREWLKDNLAKGFIRPSSSPAASPVLFVKKPGGKLRLCMDYRALNSITIKNRYPIPLVSETLDRLSKARYFTKVDVISAFNRIRIAKGDEWKTAFRTRYGLFESLVMPFGLTNAPATFQSYINNSLQEYLDVFTTAYLDDVLIYSTTREEHRNHVKLVLDKLRNAGLQLDIEKCQFEAAEIKYLGLMISRRGISMDPMKIDCIKKWNTPVNVRDIQAFLAFANFYRRFIKEFSRIARPLINLTKKKCALELVF